MLRPFADTASPASPPVGHATFLRKMGGSVMLAVLERLCLQAGATVGRTIDLDRLVVAPRLSQAGEAHE